uniref:SGNH hydrolase-type esterase domain-containing protein n=1 Tax=Tanacetum cinerariifolium TaxID=118510 RepID=A0A6L2LKP4_TANCI|nr:SGNH hydrolase-type esterase domain-containing protein [Tanacetum cinerariifolium]
MAALRYKDKHNKVGYLLKPTGSDDYHPIIDFLRASHIRYALTHDPIIFDSLVKQFWSTARSADDCGIDDLPIAEIYSGMDNLGFLQTILGIETRNKRQYKVLRFSSKVFANIRLNFEGHPMPHLAAMLSQDQEGEGAGVAAQALPQHMPAPDQPQDHLSTPPRQQTSDPTALVFEQDEIWEALSICLHQGPLKLPLQKVNSLETGLKDHKKLFKDVVGKLVKAIEQEVDLDALLALANAAVTVDSNISPGGAFDNPAASTSVPADVPTSANVPTGSTSIPADVPTSVAPAGISNKGKTPMVEEDITVKERTFKQMQEDKLGKQVAKRLHDEEQAQVDRQRVEMHRRRQQEVLALAMYYTEADWINIMA